MSPASTEVETVTLGELNRTLNRVATTVDEMRKEVTEYPKWPDIKRIEQQQDAARNAVVKLANEQHKAMESRIEVLESWQTWAGRSILGALIAGAVALLYVFN